MKTIEEINEIAPYHPCEWQEGYGIWQAGFMEGQKVGVAERKVIDIDKACDALCKATCKGYQDTKGLCFTRGACEKYRTFRKALEK